MKDEDKQAIVQAALDKQVKPSESVQGWRSGMKCTCGGALIQTRQPNMFRVLSGGYTCEACRRSYSTTTAIARNLIQVERMPDGARPIYSSEPNDDLADGPKDEA